MLHAWENRGAADVSEHRTISDEPAESLADHSLDSPRIVGELVVIHDTDVDTEQGEQWRSMNMHTVTLTVAPRCFSML